jgi:Methylamine utilisation protein MauE
MNLKFSIDGITCYKCVINLKNILSQSSLSNAIEDMNIDSDFKHLHLRLKESSQDTTVTNNLLNQVLKDSKFQIHDINDPTKNIGWFEQYKSIILIFFVSLVAELILQRYFHHRYQVFMSFWLILFAMPKLNDLQGFAKQFRKYDLLAQKSVFYAFIFPFIELFAGLAHLNSDVDHSLSYLILTILSITSLSVIKVMLEKKDIKCACLGSSSKMKIGFVTLLENILMIIFSLLLILGTTV